MTRPGKRSAGSDDAVVGSETSSLNELFQRTCVLRLYVRYIPSMGQWEVPAVAMSVPWSWKKCEHNAPVHIYIYALVFHPPGGGAISYDYRLERPENCEGYEAMWKIRENNATAKTHLSKAKFLRLVHQACTQPRRPHLVLDTVSEDQWCLTMRWGQCSRSTRLKSSVAQA
jgi:hypothetical protein